MMEDNNSLESNETQKKYYETMSEKRNIRKVSLENIKEAELSIIYVRKKKYNIIDDLRTSRNVSMRQRKKLYKYNKFKIFRCSKPNQKIKSYSKKESYNNYKGSCRHNTKIYSMPVISYLENERSTHSSTKSCDNFLSSNPHVFKSNFTVNTIKLHSKNAESSYFNNYSFPRPCWKVYRCQLNAKEETCCCSCNSDAMFEVMKSLYDCYKKKNCDNCNCILCAHLPREERRLGELRKLGIKGDQLSIVPLSEFMQPAYIKKIPSAKVQQLKAAGLLTPLEGKSSNKKEEILRGLAINGIPLPKGKSTSDKKLIDKIRKEIGLPPEPKSSDKKKYEKAMAMGFITPLLGKSSSEKERILKGQADLGLALPEGRTISEKNLIAKIKTLKAPSSKFMRDKTPEEKEDLLRDLAMKGIPLPEGKTASEKKIIDKVRTEVGLPPTPKTAVDKKRYKKAIASGLITPLEGKSASEKEIILKGQADLGLALPEGRTVSEKKLIAKIKSLKVPSSKLLQDKTLEEKEDIIKDLAIKGMPLPEAKSASEKKMIDKVRAEVGLPPTPKTPSTKERYDKALAAGHIVPLEGKTGSQKEKILREQAKLGVLLPEGRTPSEKALIAKVKAEFTPDRIKRAKAGMMTPLHGKTPEQKESILRELAMHKIPLPEAKTASEKKIIDKVRKEVGLPPEPKSEYEKANYDKAIVAGIITPLEGKSESQKEKILIAQADMGIQLPEGRTASEKALIKKIKKRALPPEKRKKLDEKTIKVVKEGKGPSDECICGIIAPESVYITPEKKERKMRELAMQGFPLPEAKTASEKKILGRIQADLGLPPVPTTPSMKEKYTRAHESGIIQPLEGKTKSQKAKILIKQAAMGVPLPDGRTSSEKALVNKVRATVKPLVGKTPEEQKKILQSIVKAGLPLPDGTTPSEKLLIKAIKDDTGLPSKGIPSELFYKAKAAGLITPLEGKTKAQKEKILRDKVTMGLPLPEGVTPSDKELIQKIKQSMGYTTPKYPSKIIKAKSTGLVTPLEGKTRSQKEKILEHQVAAGLPLPEGKTPSEKELIEKVRKKKTPKLLSLKGQSPSQKEKILRHLAKQGLPLPEPKTASDKAIINKVKAELVSPEKKTFSAKLRSAKAAGLLTPLEGKAPEQKENILRGLVKAGIPLPEGKTNSEKKIINKIREEVGLPPEPKTPSLKEKMKQAQIAGIVTPLNGKTPSEKEKILIKMHDAGIPLPKGRTASEKSLVKKVKAGVITRPHIVASKKLREAKAAGLLTPLEGKTPAQKEKILTGLAKAGLPFPEGKTHSEKALINKVQEKIKKIDKESAKVIKEGKGPSDECICDMLAPMKPQKKTVSMKTLVGKTPEEKEKYLKDLALQGIPLPEAKTKSDKKLISKIRADIGLPPEPTTLSLKEKYDRALEAGLITPLQGKSDGQKEKILRAQAAMGLSLPEGRTRSEKNLIAKVKAITPPVIKVKSEKLRKAKAAGLLTPLEGKSPEQKEKNLKVLAMHGIPLPEPKTSSERNIMDKIRAEVGLPPEPKSPQGKERYNRAIAAGIITPLQGKSPSLKEKILRGQAEMGLPLPEGRTRSEKDLIAKIRATTLPLSKVHIPLKSEKLRKAKAAGVLTPLVGKSPEQKEKILKGLAMHGIPLPEPQTSSERNIINKVRAEIGLPSEPKTPQEKEMYDRAIAAGIITPLQGKTPSQKEKILRGQAEMGLPLPEGRTRSEKDLIAKVKATTSPVIKVKSEKLRKAKAAGLLTPLEGKSPEQKENILKGLAMHGIPLPEPKTSSERNIIDKVRAEIGLPPEPKSREGKERYDRAIAAGIITPLQGKSPSIKEKILRGQAEMGLPLPEGRTRSEKDLIAKVRATALPLSKTHIPLKSEKIRKAKAAGVLTPLVGKSPEQKEKILKGLAMHGIPLPEPKTSSERNIIDKVRAEVGLPPEPKTQQEKEMYDKALAAGIITPLQGKSPSHQEKILRGQAEMGLPLPEGRTRSEKDLIAKVKATTAPVIKVKSEKLRKAKAAGLLTPLEGKTAEQKEKLLKGLAMHGIPLPEPKTSSERNIIDKVRAEVGLPPEPKSRQGIERYNRAIAAGIITPLQGKSPSIKEKILRGQAEMGLTLPEGRTRSEKDLIAKVKATTLPLSKVHIPLKSEKLRKAKAAGVLTPLDGKSPEQKEKILKGLAMHGIPLPKPKTSSERNIIDKVRAEVGLPPEPKTQQEKAMYDKAIAAGIITPLQGKSPLQKEKILREQAEMGLPLPEGRTRSEKDLIAKVKATTAPVVKVKSEKMRKAKAAGLLTPLEGKSPEQKEKIMKGLAMHGIPLPEPKTSSERNIIDKVRAEVGLPPEPKTQQERDIYDRAIAAGIITPLQGKTPSQKEKILRGQAEMGLRLPEGRTRSEKDLVTKVKETTPPVIKVKSEKLRKAKVAGLLTPLEGKSPEKKENILKGLAMHGIPLPEPKTSSERNIMNKVRAEVGLPPEPKTQQEKEIYDRAIAAGIITPLEGKSPSQKEKILRSQAKMGLPLPKGRTASEKALIKKVKLEFPRMLPEQVAKLDKKTAKVIKEGKGPSDECICQILSPRRPSFSKKSSEVYKIPSEKLRKAKETGLLTPLEGKTTAQKEKIIKGLALQGIPLPSAKTDSEKKLIDKVRVDLGLPLEPKTKSAKKIYNKALADGYITPLQGKTNAQKEKILRKQAEIGLILPEGRTPSEKSIIAKIKETMPPPLETLSLRKKISKARAAGLLTPLEGKTFAQKEKILKTLAEAGLPLPEGKTPSEKSLIKKVETEYGKLPKAKTKSKKVGDAASGRSRKRISKTKGGITEEFEDIIKTTTCDRGCGCDKKKIRFKHSYVKIRVTSPDISSLCPCPEECVPGVKGGIFTDNEGIKVTVGRVTGIPSFSSRKSFDSDHPYLTSANIPMLKKKTSVSKESDFSIEYNMINYTNYTKSETEIKAQNCLPKQCHPSISKVCVSCNNINNFKNDCVSIISSVEIIQSFKENCNKSNKSQGCFITHSSNKTSYESIYLLNRASSVSLLTLPTSISIISFSTRESSSNSSFHKDKISYSDLNLSECLQSTNTLTSSENIRSSSFESCDYFADTYSQIRTNFEDKKWYNILTFLIKESKACYLTDAHNFTKNESNIVHNTKNLDIHDFICEILSKRQINSTSSLVIVVSTISNDRNSKYSLAEGRISSTIGIDLLENYSKWNYKANSLHHLHQKQKGFKIASKGRTYEKNNTSTILNDRNTTRNTQHKRNLEQKHQTYQNDHRIISTDTTQDRPCCCDTKESRLNVPTDQRKVDSIVTELVTPIILKEVGAQGLSHETYINPNNDNIIEDLRLTVGHSNPGTVTPIRFCKIPPCNNRTKKHYHPIPLGGSTKIISSNDAASCTTFKTCDCNPEKLIELFEKRTKEMVSKACNICSDELIEISDKKEHTLNCDHCESKTKPNTSNSNAKKVKNLCPCEQHTIFKDNDIDDQIINQKGTYSKDSCQCKKQKPFKKNIICECPVEPEPEIDFTDWVSEEQVRKYKSDLTQTLSGFKINKPRRRTRDRDRENLELEMSFEETLRYIAENLENESNKYNSDICSCKSDLKLQSKSKNVSVDCECPYEPSTPEIQEETFEEEPFMGIKFHISGKGSGSKGLNGILCFQLLKSLSKQFLIQKDQELCL